MKQHACSIDKFTFMMVATCISLRGQARAEAVSKTGQFK